VTVNYVDQVRGSPYPTWRALGAPQYPSHAQMVQIKSAAELAPPQVRRLGPAADLVLELPPEGVALIEVEARA
jgi:xylan 1,4-beta-xylosidase